MTDVNAHTNKCDGPKYCIENHIAHQNPLILTSKNVATTIDTPAIVWGLFNTFSSFNIPDKVKPIPEILSHVLVPLDNPVFDYGYNNSSLFLFAKNFVESEEML